MQQSKYVIRLSRKDKRDLRALTRKGKTEARLADRARILLWADRNEVTIEETARRLDCGRDKVIFWRRRFLEGRQAKQPLVERLGDQPRSGRPPAFSLRDRETVVLTTLAHHQTADSTG
ncbi:MAG: helix-turn-helix domain-containing protein [Chloroflexi bacterium]|nr:helix-turn-helix domain-containing protein [Chloroflexota bacterium]